MSTIRQEASSTASQGMAAVVAALVMAVGMGFGRFAFTGIYPVMVSDAVLTVHQGTLAASANYAGYLLGALLTAAVHPRHSRRVCVLALGGIVLCLGVTALLSAPWLIIAMRGITGSVSAVTMVAASLWLLQHRGHTSGAPLLYAGVGMGIVLSSEMLVAGRTFDLHSAGLWWVLAAGSLILAVIALPGLDSRPVEATGTRPALHGHESFPALGAGRLIALYGLAGFGYIITATYLPFFVRNALGSIDPIQVWALFGLGAVPSCFIWHAVHMRLGTRRALFVNLALQAAGVILPVLAPNPAGYLGSALIVGGTFMGTTTISMLAGRRVAHTLRVSILAVMTACFGIGQIVGPLVANAMYAPHHSFSGSLSVAAAALAVAALLCVRFTPAKS
ncbi:MFS family permease [Caballeronia udeis]|uniref:MFS family permease n=1 Tax=Caballeronia udeis TaxID=1232866 RepID=A0ABW8MUA8_9BURK